MSGGNGPAPKDAGARVRRAEPARGEWVYLPPIGKKPILAAQPPGRGRGNGAWNPRTLRAWKQWRQDPATTQWGPAEISACEDLAFLHHGMCTGTEKASEVRLRMDGLGLTAKGKRDLRWRAPTETATAAPPEEEKPAKKPAAGRRHLRAV